MSLKTKILVLLFASSKGGKTKGVEGEFGGALNVRELVVVG